MKSFLDPLSHLEGKTSSAIMISILLALLMIVLLFLLIFYAIKKAKNDSPEDSQKQPVEDLPISEYRMPPFGGRLAQYLSLKGVFRVGEISTTFLRVLAFLRDHLDNLTYKYQLPWYLMVGASNSGKSTLLESAGMTLPVGMPNFGVINPHPACRWWFYNRAVVLDVHGSLVIEERKAAADEKGWRTILSLLGRYRAKRPLDGIILTISATELYGKERLTPENINARAKFLSQKLIAAQHLLGLRLPVYVIVTKCDFLPGFQSFCHELPIAQQQNMLGWSVPYALHSAYSPHWIDEAFQTISDDFSSLQLEMYTHNIADENKEGIFVLPDEFFSMKNNLKFYLDHIFKSSAYEESLMLRGIYFCGDSGQTPAGIILTENIEDENLDQALKADLSLSTQTRTANSEALRLWENAIHDPSDHTQQAQTLSPEASQYSQTRDRHICFGKDIFEKKIFFESGLAYPIYSRLVSANRNINLAKAGMIAFVGIGTFGIFNAYDNFTKNRDFLMPVLGKVNGILSQLPHHHEKGSSATEALFETQTKSLLDMMNHLHRTSFFSLFIPSSWFSPLQDHLNSSLKISYEQIILRTIYMDLLLKARDVLNMRPGMPPLSTQERTTSVHTLLTPTTTVEFQQVKTYVDYIHQLVQNIGKYNQLREAPDPALLKDLVEYTFGIHLPTEFSNSYQRFIKVLQEAPYPPIELKGYYPIAQNTLYALYTNFLNVLFLPSDPMSLIGQLRYLMQSIGQGQLTQPINLDFVRNFVSGLTQGISSLGPSGHNWIDADYFDPGSEFASLINKIHNLEPFGPAVVEQLAKETSITYNAFHQELLQINRLFSNASPNGHKAPKPSESIFNLEKALTKLFAEPFMAKTNGEMFITQVPEDKVISWNPQFITEAISLIKSHDTFIAKELNIFPIQLKEAFKKIAWQNLQLNVISHIAKAQTFTSLPTALQAGDANEELLRSQIGNIKTSIPSFIKLLETLNDAHNGSVFVSLQNLLGIMATRFLEKVDALLISYQPYHVRNNNFDWWDGKTPVFLAGFNVKDGDELKSYLSHQRQLITHLAFDYADPLLTLLTSDMMKVFPANQALVNRWHRILEQVSSYDKKLPNSSVITLENFIEKDATDLTMHNCFEKLSLEKHQKTSHDFFLDRLIQLKRALMARCEVSKRQESIKNYQELVSIFNESFKDKFPFVGENASVDQAEVDPADIKHFFSLYHDFGNSPKDILEQVYQLGDAAKEPYEFLKSMESVKKFFHTFLNSQLQGDVPAFDFAIDFRVNKDREVSGNMIIDWSIAAGDAAPISNTSKSKTGRWTYGNPVTMTFRWPDSSETEPFADKDQSFMSVDAQTVTFTYPGQWAIFWLLRSQRTTSDDFAGMQDTQPYTLRFEIPNGPEDKTVVYDRITFHKPAKDKKPGAIINVPSFPTEAPDLDQSILDQANKPVIAQGLVEPSREILEDIASTNKDKKKKKDKKKGHDEEAPEEADSEDKPPKGKK